MKIHIRILTLLILGLMLQAKAQTQLHIKTGFTASSFFYKNSKEQSAKDLQFLIGNYTSLGCDANFGGHFIRPELGFRQAGAITYINRSKIKWDIKYIDLHFGYGYNYYRGKKVMLGVGAGINLGVLLNGEQTTGSEAFNLLKEKAMRQIDLGANGFANAKIKMADGVYLSLEYRYNVSMLNIETDSNSPQTTRNQSHNFLAGIAITLKSAAQSEKNAQGKN